MEFLTAPNGEVAQKMIKEGCRPEVIIVDYKIPPENGLQLLNSDVVKTYLPNTLKIIISSSIFPSVIQDLQKQAAERNYHFFSMPVRAGAIYDLIEKETGIS